MAKQKTGRPRQFPLDLQETKEAIRKYKIFCEDNPDKIPSIPEFCAFIGTDVGKYMDTVYHPLDINTNLSDELKILGTWVDGQIIDKCPAPVARILLAQGFGGYAYMDKAETKQDVSIQVNFGGSCKDPFG